MKTVRIPLTRGQFATIDEADLPIVDGFKWKATPRRKGAGFYATRSATVNGRETTVYMHRLILGASKGSIVDHKDGDGLNNTRSNIREGSQAQNMANAGMRPQNTSGHIGVYWDRNLQKWVAQIKVRGKNYKLGAYGHKEDAARARAEYANRVHGEWASRYEADV